MSVAVDFGVTQVVDADWASAPSGKGDFRSKGSYAAGLSRACPAGWARRSGP